MCSVHLYTQSECIVHKNLENTYEKGSLFCVLFKDGRVMKYPLQHIFRIQEVECEDE